MSFNRDFAAKYFDIVAKMDDDSAAMFQQMVVHGVLMDDLANNRRTVSKAVDTILGEIRDEVAKSLQAREGQPAAHATAALVGVVSKARDFATNYEELYHRPQPRDKSGRWTVNFSASREKNKPGKLRAKQHMHVGDFDVTSALGTAGKEGSRFAQKWHERGTDEYSTTSGMYNRIEAGSRVLTQAGNATGNAKLRLAGEAGQFLGQYGPQAESVVGPHMRRTAYRYRGTERTPDAALGNQVRDNVAAIGRAEGLTSNSEFTTPMMNTAAHRAAINYLSQRIPKKSLSELQQKSGKIPPSEGVIINGDGKIITQAVGYMDDHYLPFNLKNLKGLKGGSYVRTRSSGGLTTEDIYTGLMTGARSVTVVSRSGVFTMDFEDDFRGGRRFNDKAAGMISRYAKTLDAVQSKQVTRAPMSMEDRLRIRDEVEDEMLGFPAQEVEDEIKRRTKEAQSRPTLSQREMDEINRKAVEAASEGGQAPRGQFSPREWDRIKDDPKKRILAYKSSMIEDALREKEATKFQLDGEGYAVALDALREQFPYYIQNVEYIHNKDPRAVAMGLSPESDAGYVKPKYNRPEGAKEGWYDESIGHKKISADRTNYQNWSHRKGTLKPVQGEAVEGEETAEGPAKAKASAGARMKNAAAQGHAEAAIGRELQAMVDETRQIELSPGENSRLIETARTPAGLDTILGNPGKMEDLERAMKDLQSKLAAEGQDWATNASKNLQRRLDLVEAHRTVVGGEEWNPANYKGGKSPNTPWKFDGEAYMAGQDPQVYQNEWDRIDDRIKKHFPDFGGLPADPAQLKRSADAFGAAYRVADQAASEKLDTDEIMRRLSIALDEQRPSPQRLAEYANMISRNPDLQKRRWLEMVDGLERARRIKAVAPEAEKAAPAASTQTVQGTAREIVQPEAKDSAEDFKNDIYQFSQGARTLEERNAFRLLHRGIDKNNMDNILNGLAQLEELNSEGAKMIRDRMKKLGMLSGDFDADN